MKDPRVALHPNLRKSKNPACPGNKPSRDTGGEQSRGSSGKASELMPNSARVRFEWIDQPHLPSAFVHDAHDIKCCVVRDEQTFRETLPDLMSNAVKLVDISA